MMKWTEREERALEAGLKEAGFFGTTADSGVFVEVAEKLNIYARELLLWNNTHGLVGLEKAEELIHRHFLDSLAAVPFIGNPDTLADVGSGAGLPGIPLALALPETKVFLIEKMGRRCDFLRNVLALTGLSGRVEVLQETLEKCTRTFDVVTLRAFAPLPRVFDGLSAITAPGGRILSYKGRVETFKDEILGDWDTVVEPLRVPGEPAERNLVIIRC